MKTEIEKPTVGRIVLWFHGSLGENVPMAAIVAGIYPSQSLTINVGAFNIDGEHRSIRGLQHKSEAGEAAVQWWDWMPYQKGQAAKTAELQAQLDQKAAELGKLQAGAPSPVDGKR